MEKIFMEALTGLKGCYSINVQTFETFRNSDEDSRRQACFSPA